MIARIVVFVPGHSDLANVIDDGVREIRNRFLGFYVRGNVSFSSGASTNDVTRAVLFANSPSSSAI
jgi:hypothetical protein